VKVTVDGCLINLEKRLHLKRKIIINLEGRAFSYPGFYLFFVATLMSPKMDKLSEQARRGRTERLSRLKADLFSAGYLEIAAADNHFGQCSRQRQ
jgi:hypothetical protein